MTNSDGPTLKQRKQIEDKRYQEVRDVIVVNLFAHMVLNQIVSRTRYMIPFESRFRKIMLSCGTVHARMGSRKEVNFTQGQLIGAGNPVAMSVDKHSYLDEDT